MRIFFLLIVFSATVCVAQKSLSIDKKFQEFEAYILKAQKDWEVPGLAVAVVKDGKVLLAKGYGVRELGKPDPVNAQTLFACASTTKAMVASCMGMLVDEGKVSWDEPVYKHLPEFQLYDPYVTRELRIRDLFIHNSGVGNADFLWSVMDISTEEVLYKMRNVEPSYSLRSSFIYQNIFYVVAGEVIKKLSGKPWNEFISERLFKPLGMTRTVPLLQQVTDANQTKPHFKIEGTITVIEHTSADRVGAAGSVWSCIDDMSKWVACLLDSSKYPGGRLLSPKTWTELFKPQVIVPASQFYPTAHLTHPNWTTYGLGWFQHDYKGKKVNFHTGSLAGAIAMHGQLPKEKLGIYIFGNLDHAELRHALMYKAFDVFALGGTRDWSTEFLQLYKEIQTESEKKERDFESKRIEGTKPTLPLDDYTGKYMSPVFGELIITREGDQLTAVANGFLKATFSHWYYDTFRGWFEKKWYGKENLSFVLGPAGKVSSVEIAGMDFNRMN
jgi:CubicO group peptidase (beta-lactamase class C family)